MRNLCFVATAFFVTASLPCQGGPFSFPNGQAPRDVVIPAVVPVLFGAIKPGDAPLILRTTTLLNNVWFDAIAPYSDNAVGICSTIPRRPAAERNDTNRNIAIFYASLRMLDSLFPAQGEAWRAMLQGVGLDPLDQSMDLTTPVGVGNHAGLAVVGVREHDGMNQLGDEVNPSLRLRTDVGRPYWDYTGYKPKNTPYELRWPGRWQPAITDNGYGIFQVQQFITPQYAKVTPYSYNNPNQYRAPRPKASRSAVSPAESTSVMSAPRSMSSVTTGSFPAPAAEWSGVLSPASKAPTRASAPASGSTATASETSASWRTSTAFACATPPGSWSH